MHLLKKRKYSSPDTNECNAWADSFQQCHPTLFGNGSKHTVDNSLMIHENNLGEVNKAFRYVETVSDCAPIIDR